MLKIKEAIIVEGRYDKNKLSQIVDTIIIETKGFGIFKDKEMQKFIKMLALERGIIILTDSDSSGVKIRNFIRSIAADGEIKNVYIPRVLGKEKRKSTHSKEGFLGVEGIDSELLAERLCEVSSKSDIGDELTKMQMYEDGFFGRADSKKRREELLLHFSLPKNIPVNLIPKAVEVAGGISGYREYIKKRKEGFDE